MFSRSGDFTSDALSIALALLSAVLFAVSASLQQGSARRAALARPESGGFFAVAGIARTILTSRRWLFGQVASVAGFASHALALRYGPLPMVQALLVVQLLFALPLAARRRSVRLLRRDWAGTVAVVVGLVLVIAQGAPHGPPRYSAMPEAGGAILAAIVLLLAASRLTRSPQLRAALTAMSAGCCVSITAVLTAIALPALPQFTWALLGIPLSTSIGAVLTQEAFASGSLPTALTTMTITDPLLSYTAGMTLFVASSYPHPLPLGLAAGLVGVGVVLLANSPTLHDERDRAVTVPPEPTPAHCPPRVEDESAA